MIIAQIDRKFIICFMCALFISHRTYHLYMFIYCIVYTCSGLRNLRYIRASTHIHSKLMLAYTLKPYFPKLVSRQNGKSTHKTKTTDLCPCALSFGWPLFVYLFAFTSARAHRAHTHT